MRSLRRMLAGSLIAAAALILPFSGTSHAISLRECVGAGGSIGVGNGWTYCHHPNHPHHGQIIGSA